MQSLSNYQKKVSNIITSIHWNVLTDYEGEFTEENFNNVIHLYANAYQQSDPKKRQKLYLNLKENITNENQLQILRWMENQRGQKYLGQNLPASKTLKKYNSIDVCPNPDFLDPTRIVGLSQYIPVQQKASLDPVTISQSVFMIEREPQFDKSFLFRKVRQRQERPTPWVVQKTKDHRYIWRAITGIDRYDVFNLLMFILLKRSKYDTCPSIFINTGSHGDILGNIASDYGNFMYTAQSIRDQTLNSLYEMVESDGHKMRINKANIKVKVCINFMSSSYPCIYPDRADHIIDTQCFGAYKSIKAQRLHPPGSLIKEEDLMFLEGTQQQTGVQQTSSQNTNPQEDIVVPDNKQIILIDEQGQIISELINKLVQGSKIISNEVEAYTLINFFHFTYQTGVLETAIKHKRLTDLKLLFRASQHDFDIKEYFRICEDETFTFILCRTQKDKIIGAYSPLRLSFKESFLNNLLYQDGKWASDHDKDSFIFSVSNTEAFYLGNVEKAVYRKRDRSRIIFGCLDFSICDKANVVKDSIAINNVAYVNDNYEKGDPNTINVQSCIRFNGTQNRNFLIKQWQVWKIQLQYID